ncbi:MAG: HAMP domain-containing sensor histidine kinase [Pseudomonadota bacterium]
MHKHGKLGARIGQTSGGGTGERAGEHRGAAASAAPAQPTALRQQDDGLRQISVAAEEQERLASRISVASHELNTPLTSLRGSLSLLAAGVSGGMAPQVHELVAIAKSNCERLAGLIENMLDAQRIRASTLHMELRRQTLHPLIEQAVETARACHPGQGIALQCTAASIDAMVLADGARVAQVMASLLSNACKHAPRGSAVEVRLEAGVGAARVTVRDHGAGVPEHFRAHLFQPYMHADMSDGRRTQGAGLSLHIAKALIDLHYGVLALRMGEGGPTEFYFELPLVAGQESEAHHDGGNTA